MSDPNIHRPAHMQLCPEGVYFITARIYSDEPLLKSDVRKELLFDILVNKCSQNNVELIAWTICDDHYHFMIYSDKEFDLGYIMGRIHSVSATLLNREDKTLGRKVWYQYWDTWLRTEEDFFLRFNYIHWNPIKHGYVKDLVELEDYEYCSFSMWKEVLGQEAVELFFEQYPIEDFDPFKR